MSYKLLFWLQLEVFVNELAHPIDVLHIVHGPFPLLHDRRITCSIKQNID